MPVTYEIDKDARMIRTRCSGQVTIVEVVEHFMRLAEDPKRPNLLHVLLDLSETTSSPVTEHLKTVRSTIGAMPANLIFGVCAIAAPGDTMYGVAQTFSTLTGHYFAEVRTFRDVAKAEEWLKEQVRGWGRPR